MLVVLVVGGNGVALFLLAVRYWLELRARRRGFVGQSRKRLDNRRANLRLCTPQGNSENRGPTRSSRSGVRGVSWHAGVGKWQATVWLRGRSYYLGIFDSVEEAGAVAAAFRAEHMPFSEEANAA
jgi:hypothetical protein